MTNQFSFRLIPFAFFAVFAFVLAASGSLRPLPAMAQDQTAAEKETEDKDDVGWPRELKSDLGTITVYQPQFDELVGADLKGRAAFGLKEKEDSEPEYGALFFEARVEADNEERLAYVNNVKITRVALPDADEEKTSALTKAIQGSVGKGAATISLDRLAVALREAEVERKESENLNNDAPKIIIKSVPAVLLYVDGKPKMSAIEGTSILAMENSPFPIVLDPGSKKYYLNGGAIWYEAGDVKGPWKFTEKVPDNVKSLIQLTDEQKKDLKDLIGGEDEDDRIPEIVYTDVPSELVIIDGKPSFTPLVGADLLYVENSESLN